MDAGTKTEKPGRQVLDMIVTNLIFGTLSLRILGSWDFFHVELPFTCLETCTESEGESLERGMQMGVKRTELELQPMAPVEVKTETGRRQEAWRRNRQQE